MARIRSDKPEAYQSETLAQISLAAERTFKGMATIADDRGRLADKPALINGELWSMRGDHTTADLENELDEMTKTSDPLICRYVGCNGKRYLHLVTWDWHQKIDHPSKVRLPRCPHHPVSVTGRAEECGLHPGPCPNSREYVASPREPSRGARPGDAGVASGQGEPAGDVQGSENGGSGAGRSDLREPESSRGSRESSRGLSTDLGSRTLDLGSGSIPPTAGASKPRRRRTARDASEFNPGPVVAAFVDGATEAGLKRPASSLCARVGKQARELYRDGYAEQELISSARNMGAGEWNDLAVQVRKDDAAANGAGPGVARKPLRERGASDDLSDQVYGQGKTRI